MPTLQTPFSYERLNPVPLDVSAVFDNLAAFQAYLTGPVAYAGQIVAVRNPPNAPTLYCVSEGPPFSYVAVGAAVGSDLIGVTTTAKTALGVDALKGNIGTSTTTTVVGNRALESLVHTTGNTVVGASAARLITSGNYNSVLGNGALTKVGTNISFNTAIGDQALGGGTYNSAVGASSMSQITNGGYNSAIGASSIPQLTSGNYNIAMGYLAGRARNLPSWGTLTTASNSIFIGYDTLASTNGVDNEIVIGTRAIGKGSNTISLGSDAVTQLHTPAEIYEKNSRVYSANYPPRITLLTTPPDDNQLAPGELGCQYMATPPNLWIGIPPGTNVMNAKLIVGVLPAPTVWDGGATTWDAGATTFDVFQ